ncbi:hypothetical protein Tco_1047810 [Tanacetum coccineum]
MNYKKKGKEIGKPNHTPSESTSEEDSDPEQAQKDKEMQKKNLASHCPKNAKKTKTAGLFLILKTPLSDTDEEIDEYKSWELISCYMANESSEVYYRLRNCSEPLEQVALQNKQTEFERYKAFNDRTVDYDKLKRKLNETLGLLAQKDIDIKEGLKVKAYEISVVKENHDEFVKQSLLTKSHYEGLVKEKTKIPHDQSDPVNRLVSDREETQTLERDSREKLNKDLVELVNQAWVKHSRDHFRAQNTKDMEILIKTCLMPLALKIQNDSFAFVHELKQEMHADLNYVESLEVEIDELEYDKAEFSNMYDMLLQECVSNDVMCSYLHSLSDLDAHTELQCVYLHKVKECECLVQKLSKQTEFVKQMKNDTVCKEKASNVFLKEREQYFEIQDLKAQLQDKDIAICELKKLIEKCKGKSMETKFDKPSIVRQPNAQRIPKPLVLGKPTPFSDSLERKHFSKTKSVPKTNVSEGLSKPVTTQNLPQTARQAPKVVPISTRKPKSQANKSIATHRKKIVASEFTVQNSKSYYRMLYERTSKAWKWWIEQQWPSGYKWVPKTKMKWVPKVRNENVQKRVSFAIDNASRITNVLKLTNNVGSNLSCIQSSSNSLADYTTHPIHC